ncbi:MAG: hypothetical protein QM813_26510 [Verrucomicrobiota bacterium]
MKNRIVAVVIVLITSFGLGLPQAGAQILLSSGAYTQNFDSLATTGTSNPWMDNTTLLGWYAAKTIGGTTVTAYRGESGASNAGALYSFGVSGVSNLTDRALGSLASGTRGTSPTAFGLPMTQRLHSATSPSPTVANSGAAARPQPFKCWFSPTLSVIAPLPIHFLQRAGPISLH